RRAGGGRGGGGGGGGGGGRAGSIRESADGGEAGRSDDVTDHAVDRRGRVGAQPDHPVAGVHVYHPRPVLAGRGIVHLRVRDENDPSRRGHQAGGGGAACAPAHAP